MTHDPATQAAVAPPEDVGQPAPNKIEPNYFIGNWSVGDFEFVMAGKKYASRKTFDHEGSHGDWTLFEEADGKAYLILTLAAVFPQSIYGMQYTGNGQQGATKIEFPKQMALLIESHQENRFTCQYQGIPMTFERASAVAEPLLVVRIEELKSMLAIEEAAFASKLAAWNNQFGVASDLQELRWKQINSWKLP